MADLPSRARVVIIGGGVGGTSVAYHLAALGERDVLLVDRSDLTSGSTFHSAGLVGQLRSDPALTAMNVRSVALYRALQETDTPPGWVETGSLRLASSPERLEEIRRQLGWASAQGLSMELLSADEAASRFPLMSTEGVLGAAWMPTDGQVDPSQLTFAMAAGARAHGAMIRTKVRVLGIDVTGEGDRRRVTRVRTDSGDVECEVVVDCGGMFAASIARMVDVRVPIVPMSHQYVVTEPFLERREQPLPALRDPDHLVYWRQEVDGLLMGGYERQSLPWSTSASAYDVIPSDFNGKLLPPDWERFVEISENAAMRVPVMGEIGIRSFINGPEGFTPDNEFCLGETEVGGFFIAAGFCAHGIAGAGGIGSVMAEWILSGDPGLDVWHMDVRRFGRQYRSPSYTMARVKENYESYYDIRYPGHERTSGRPLRMSPAYPWHVEHGAVFGEKSGWERVNYYASHEEAGDPTLAPRGWAAHHWSPAIGVEHRAARESAAIFDESSFAKLEVSGPDASALMQWLCDNDVARGIGDVTYTQMLNERGGIECDVTVTRVASDVFWIVTGTAFGAHDGGWIRRQARLRDADVRVVDVTGAWATFGLWGPLAHQIVAPLTPQSLADEDFPFMSMRETTVGDVPVRMVRVTYVGEHGWELSCSPEYGLTLWRTLWAAGRGEGLGDGAGEHLVAGGYRAIDSLRLENGYRAWDADITPGVTPLEAGLGFCVRWDKAGGFLGREALVAQREAGVQRRLRCLVLSDPHAVALGGEPVRDEEGVVLGRITSGGFGYTVGRALAFAVLPSSIDVGMQVQVEVFGQSYAAEVVRDPVVPSRAKSG